MQPNQLPKQRLSKRELLDRITTWGLMIAAILGGLIALIDLVLLIFRLVAYFVPSWGFLNFFKDTDTLILIAVSALLLIVAPLSISIGLERYANFDAARGEAETKHKQVTDALTELQGEMAEVYRTLSANIPCKALVGHKAVYDETVRLIKGCKGSEIFHATSMGGDTPSQEAPFLAYLETLAKKIGEGKQQRTGMVYQVVMGFQLDNKGEPPLNKQSGILKRRELFKQNNVLDRLQIKYLDTSWSLDLFIVDDEHMVIGFSTVAGDREIRLGIRITDRVFVGHIARWYNEHLWNEAKPLTWTGGII